MNAIAFRDKKQQMDDLAKIRYVNKLRLSGYARISGRHSTIARIDRRQWLRRVAKHLGSEDAALAMKRHEAADMYRRFFSADRITVSREIAQALPSSLDGPHDFIPSSITASPAPAEGGKGVDVAHEPDCNLNMASVERKLMGCDCRLKGAAR